MTTLAEAGVPTAPKLADGLVKFQACLSYFLSFALGRWVGVDLIVGIDASGKQVYEEWGVGRTAEGQWNSLISWFDARNAELLPQVFPGFAKLWYTDVWSPALAHTLYWYVAACEGGTGRGNDAGLILAQTALELVAWTYCVQDRKMVSSRAFKRGGLIASDKFRLLASTLDIPTTIPT